jgi:DNA-binding MarR family transcriptional regulator
MFDETVHVVPFGYEYDRILEPIEKSDADTVVLLNNSSPRDTRAEFQDELQSRLEEDTEVELDARGCDIFDMYGSLESILESISDYSEDEVYVNLATGTKVTAVSGMIACMATDADPFYVKAKLSGSSPPEKSSLPGSDEVVGVPDYPIEKPTEDQIRVMEYIYVEEGTSEVRKKDMIDFADREDLSFASGSGDVSQKALYPRLNSHIVDPLVEKGFVETEKRGNTTRVCLTEEGEKAVRAFRHIV